VTGRPLALVVEDSEDQAVILRHLLEREGYDVLIAPDAETAIDAFDGIDPAIAVVDLRLPGISGAECIGRLRERFVDCALIVSSVLDEADYPDADAALPKPVTGVALRAVLERSGR